MNNKLRIGLIGVGAQATENLIPAIKLNPNTELVSACDIDKQKLVYFDDSVKHFDNIDSFFQQLI